MRLNHRVAIVTGAARGIGKEYCQTLVVTNGRGWAQCEGESIVEIHAGDLIWFPPGEPHWEGATPDQAMTYVAIQESVVVAFGRPVTDEEYHQGPPQH